MVEILIRSLFGQIGLGEIEYPIEQVRGGTKCTRLIPQAELLL